MKRLEQSYENISVFHKLGCDTIRLDGSCGPEHDDALALTTYCTQHNVVVSIGHSSATLEQAAIACANGAKSVTHTYNGMSGIGLTAWLAQHLTSAQ